jgi:hypothetical protein
VDAVAAAARMVWCVANESAPAPAQRGPGARAPSALVTRAGSGGRKLSDVEHGQPEWLAYAEPEWGFGRVTVDSGELLFEFVRSGDGAVRDSVRLRNARAGARGCQVGGAVQDAGIHTRSSPVGSERAPEKLRSLAPTAGKGVGLGMSAAAEAAGSPGVREVAGRLELDALRFAAEGARGAPAAAGVAAGPGMALGGVDQGGSSSVS